jgi:hypothetical protein
MNEKNSALQNLKAKRPTKREARISALILFAVGILALISCIHAYFKSDFLKPGAVLNPGVIDAMRGIIKVANLVVIPGLSVLLIFSSRLIWVLSNKFDGDGSK